MATHTRLSPLLLPRGVGGVGGGGATTTPTGVDPLSQLHAPSASLPGKRTSQVPLATAVEATPMGELRARCAGVSGVGEGVGRGGVAELWWGGGVCLVVWGAVVVLGGYEGDGGVMALSLVRLAGPPC